MTVTMKPYFDLISASNSANSAPSTTTAIPVASAASSATLVARALGHLRVVPRPLRFPRLTRRGETHTTTKKRGDPDWKRLGRAVSLERRE